MGQAMARMISAVMRLKAVWKSATARAFSGSIAAPADRLTTEMRDRAITTPDRLINQIDPRMRTQRAAGSCPIAPSRAGLMAVPRLAPRTRANAASGGTVPLAANDMTSSGNVRQQRSSGAAQWLGLAATITSSKGCVEIAPNNSRKLRASS